MKSRLLRSTLTHNVFSLYAGQAAIYIAPVITVPYLARVLGVSEWGTYSFALAFSTQLSLLVECGFGVTGNRAVATHRGQPAAIGPIIGAVILAKMALIVAACGIAAFEYARIPSFQHQPALFWFSVTSGITQGFSFAWYLYGIERIALAVGIDVSTRVSVAASSLLLVKSPDDAWIYFAAQTVANTLAVVGSLLYVLRANAVRWPGLPAIGTMLRQGIGATLSRPGFGVFTGLNTFLLGVYASSEVVGQYAGAERISRVVTALPGPVCLALFPRVSYLLTTDALSLRRLRTLGGTATVIVGGLASLATYLLAPFGTRLLLGPGYDGSAAILRILSPLPLLVAINQVLLYQYLFPRGAFDYLAVSLAGTTVLALATAVFLGWAKNANAIALAADVAEAAAMVCLFLRVWRPRTRFVETV